MNKRSEDFRRGVLRAFAENGYAPSDIEKALEKTSFLLPTALFGGALGGSALANAGAAAVTAPLALSLIAGGSLGSGAAYAKHKLFDSADPKEIEKFKNEKLINELRFQIKNIKRNQKNRES